MFDESSLHGSRERAAVLALMARHALPWNRLAGAVEEEGSALELFATMVGDNGHEPVPLFVVDEVSDAKPVTLDSMQDYLLQLEREGVRVLTILDDAYPANLRMVHDRPPALFLRGTPRTDDERSIAVVGTRSASSQGIATTRAIVRELTSAGYIIVSGLAAGIDTAAHLAAFEDAGRTVAVIGTGIREAFPKGNADLQARIAREGLLVSQFWPEQGPRRWTFPQRNAVMSGFARATVVVEAGKTSGARMQARLASEHGRPVFLLESLLTQDWANAAAARPGTYVVSDGRQVVEHLARLYESELASA
ncbi:MAG: DNA-processing protein DprA [Solirubrobacteraceae bacterium]